MKVVVITGSHRRTGASMLLADRFIEGADGAGHDVFRFDAAFETVGGCRGCNHCRTESRPCIQDDGMSVLNPHLIEADLVALVTPLYYFNASAQLKAVIDRFYANNERLRGGKRAVLLATSADNNDWTMSALIGWYETLNRYLEWTDVGKVVAAGCGRAEPSSRHPRSRTRRTEWE